MQFTTKKDYAYEQIKNDILTGKRKPGDKLVIRDLAEQYDMSYIPIREAISQLFHEGLVHSVPYTGTRVAEADVEKIFETTALRNAIEGICLKMAVPYITKEDIAELYGILDELQALYQSGNLTRYIVVNRSFYSCFYKKAPYRYMKEYVEELYKIGRTNTSLIAPHHIPESLEQHRRLIQLVEKGDTEGAIQCHCRQKSAAIRAVLAVMREVLMNPQLLESSPVGVFYRREDVEANQAALLHQLDRIEKLFPCENQ